MSDDQQPFSLLFPIAEDDDESVIIFRMLREAVESKNDDHLTIAIRLTVDTRTDLIIDDLMDIEGWDREEIEAAELLLFALKCEAQKHLHILLGFERKVPHAVAEALIYAWHLEDKTKEELVMRFEEQKSKAVRKLPRPKNDA